MTREQLLTSALRDLVETIDFFTDCMDNRIDREPLDPYIERAEQILEGVSPKDLSLVNWIGVDTALPDSDTTVLVSLRNNDEPVWLGFHNGEMWFSVDAIAIDVTHWAEMPAPCLDRS